MSPLIIAALGLTTLSPLAQPGRRACDVTFTTADNVEVKATLGLPDGDIFDPIPGVLLVHGGRQDRSEWASILPALHERGWATLAIDLRGHGTTGGEIADWQAFFNDAGGVPNDVAAALTFFGGHESVDAKRIAVLGSSVGGNLACVAVQKLGAIGGVCMSGKTAAAKSLSGGELDALTSMLYVAGEKEQNGARAKFAAEMAAMSAGASRAAIIEGSSAHGAALLDGNPGLARAIVDHLGGVLAAGKFKKLELFAKDGLAVTADMYGPHPADAPWVVAAHQAGWSRGEYRETAARLTALGFNVLALDQRSGGAVNDVTNETAALAKEKGLAAGYLDAEPDIIAGLEWVRELGAAKTILMGSSYSASLTLKIAAEHPKLVDAAASFSPGEYFGKDAPTLIETAAANIKVPTFITSAQREHAAWKAIFDAIPGDSKRGFVPDVAGQHGSRALWAEFEGSRALWRQLTSFLLAAR